MSRAAGIDEAKVQHVNRWRDSDVYSPLERLVLEYAECLTRTPADVSPELRAALLEHLTLTQLVELTTTIAWENFRARFNRGFDVQAQGYADGAACVLPDRGDSGSTATDS